MRFRTFLAFSALATGALLPLHGGSAFATESEVKKDELRTGSITTERTKEETLATCMALVGSVDAYDQGPGGTSASASRHGTTEFHVTRANRRNLRRERRLELLLNFPGRSSTH